ncbi:putative reverse transcriptase domain-containing protein [Tanacetum coccineum]
MRFVIMALGKVVTNLPPSILDWKGLGNRSLDLLASQPLQLMLKTGLLTFRIYSRFWDVLMNSRLGWQVTSLKEMLSIGGRLLNKPNEYFPRSEQQKYKREYHTNRQRDGETSGELMKRFLRLAGFVGKKAGPPEEQAKHFKWALCDWILDGIVNTEFTDVAQVANAARNMEILRERSSQNNKRNRDGDRIRPTARDSNQRGYDQKGYDGRSYDRQGGNSDQKSRHNRGQQYNRSSGSSVQKRYPDYASSPPCDICGKLHPGKACHRVTGACFTCGSTGHMAKDCPKNGGNGGRGDGNDNQLATKGRVFSLTKDQAANSSGTISGTLFLNGHAVLSYLIRVQHILFGEERVISCFCVLSLRSVFAKVQIFRPFSSHLLVRKVHIFRPFSKDTLCLDSHLFSYFGSFDIPSDLLSVLMTH